MRNSTIVFAASLALVWCQATAAEHAVGRDVRKLYAELCSGCHGSELEGGKGSSLADERWTHGGDDASLLRSILDGYPREGMPGFRNALGEAEAKALVAYLREVAIRKIEPEPKQENRLPLGPQQSEEHAFRFEIVARGFDVPWAFAFLPEGGILVTERVGRLRLIKNGVLQPEPIGDVPRAVVRDEAGLLGVAVHPNYAQNGWIYLSFADPGETDETTMNKIVRARLREGRLVDHETIFSVPREKYLEHFVLFGGRMMFHGQHLYFSVGERGMVEGMVGLAQDLSSPNGKIHRVFDDGSAPSDNPFVDRAGALKTIWAYGVRNPQGLAMNESGELWETEHGPRGGDELNQIEPGKNYGWPVVTQGMNYEGTPISDKTAAPGMENPVINWTPSIAVSQIEFYRGDKFPRWKGQLFIGSLAQQKFLRVALDGRRVAHTEEIFKRLGRVRDIKTGPDGFLYVALELIGKPGLLVRLVPAE